MKNIKNDWRYMRQDKYLKNMTFKYKMYNSSYSDHSHCEFCGVKIGSGSDINEGYTNEDEDTWICFKCFSDFKEMLLGECNCKFDGIYPKNNPFKGKEGYRWDGQSKPGGAVGVYYNPETGERLRPDTNHLGGKDPHWDYWSPDGRCWKWIPPKHNELSEKQENEI